MSIDELPPRPDDALASQGVTRSVRFAFTREDGGFGIYATDYPEIISQGDTEDEAIANAREAAELVFATYRETGGQPVREAVVIEEPIAFEKWLLIDA